MVELIMTPLLCHRWQHSPWLQWSSAPSWRRNQQKRVIAGMGWCIQQREKCGRSADHNQEACVGKWRKCNNTYWNKEERLQWCSSLQWLTSWEVGTCRLLTEIQLKEPPKNRYSRSDEQEKTVQEEALVPTICHIDKDILGILITGKGNTMSSNRRWLEIFCF